MTHTKIQNIPVGQLYPHPDNPRKDVGDVTELAESISKRGIMQNLTVMPISALTADVDEQPEEVSIKSDFHVLIGYRRLAAAKMAGLKEVPCEIVSKISKKEQVAIMLEENMQRNDLTIWEQAQGFQMMLDFGETADTIAEKTGFSKSTIHHRLNLAKLDQDALKECEDREDFQLSLKDLYALEQIKDVEERNKILKSCNSSKDIAWKAKNRAAEIEREKRGEEIIEILKSLKIGKAPKKYEQERYTGKWEIVKSFSLDGDVTPKITVKQNEKNPLYYYTYWRNVEVVRKAEKKKRKKTPEEIMRENIANAKKEMSDIKKRMDVERTEFVKNVIDKKVSPDGNEQEVKDAIWKALVKGQASIFPSGMTKMFRDKRWYELTIEEKQELTERLSRLPVIYQMLCALDATLKGVDSTYDYDGHCEVERCEKIVAGNEVLKAYGWTLDEEYERLLDGTHELYTERG